MLVDVGVWTNMAGVVVRKHGRKMDYSNVDKLTLTFFRDVAKSASLAAGIASHPIRRKRFFRCSWVLDNKVL